MCATKIDFKQFGFTEKQWNAMSANQKEKFQAQWNAWDEATKDKFRQVMAEKNDASGALSGDAIKTENKDKGLTVESTVVSQTAQEAKAKAARNTVPLEDNSALQKQKLEQYKKEYAELYNKDKALLKEDTVDVLYAKDKYVMEEAMKKMRESSDGRVALADRYLKEFASPEDTAKFAETYAKYLEKYQDKEVARQNFNTEFDLQDDDEGYVRPGTTITDEQIRMVAHRKALLESVNIGNDDIDKMASKFLQDRYLNAAMHDMAEADKEISEAIAKGDTKKAEKLKQKAIENLQNTKRDEINTQAKDKEELIETMAQAKLDREIAEERVARRQIFYSEDAPGYDKNNPDHKVLTDKMRAMVDEYPDMFYDENDNFSSDKFKDFFVRISNENETDDDGYEKADYMTSIQNRKRGNREKETLRREKEIAEKYPEYANPETRAQFLKNNPKIAQELNYNEIQAKFKDRKFQGACADICGLDKEKDKLAGKRALHVLTSGLKGAGMGFALGALGEGFACTKVVNKAYSGILSISGTVGFQGVQHFVKDYVHNGSVDYTHNGSVDYTHNGSVDYTHNGSVDYTHNGSVDYTHKGVVGWNASGTVDYSHHGSVPWNASGTTPSEFTWEKWENGVLDDSGTIVKDVPWSANGTADYTVNGQAGWNASGTQDYTAHGTVDYTAKGTQDYTAHGTQDYTAKGTADYTAQGTQDYTAKGQVEGDVAYKGEQDYKTQKEYGGTTSARHKFDWGVPLKAAAMGFVTGAIGGLLTMKNVKYNGGGPDIEARKKVAKRTPTPPKPIDPTPVRIPIPKPNLDIEPIKIPPLKPAEYYDYEIREQKGTEAPTHEIKYKENPKTIVEGRYGVKVGTKEYNEILAAMLEASGYEPGTNLYVGDKFVLPTVKIGDKEYAPNNDPSKVKTEDLGGKARVAHLQVKLQYEGGGWYVVDVTDPKNPKKLTGLLPQAKAEAELARLKAEAEAAGKKPKPKE